MYANVYYFRNNKSAANQSNGYRLTNNLVIPKLPAVLKYWTFTILYLEGEQVVIYTFFIMKLIIDWVFFAKSFIH